MLQSLTDSPISGDMIKVKHIYLRGDYGKKWENTLFEEDAWMGRDLYAQHIIPFMIYVRSNMIYVRRKTFLYTNSWRRIVN